MGIIVFLIVALSALSVTPAFAAQGTITEVNPSGIGSSNASDNGKGNASSDADNGSTNNDGNGNSAGKGAGASEPSTELGATN